MYIKISRSYGHFRANIHEFTLFRFQTIILWVLKWPKHDQIVPETLVKSTKMKNITFCVHLISAAYEVSTLSLNSFICSIFYFCFKSEIECWRGPGLKHTINQMKKKKLFNIICMHRQTDRGLCICLPASDILRQTEIGLCDNAGQWRPFTNNLGLQQKSKIT